MLCITPNVFDMFGYLYLFKLDSNRRLWVDAIFIHQSDLDERAVQVPQTYRILSLAKNVLCGWDHCHLQRPCSWQSDVLNQANTSTEVSDQHDSLHIRGFRVDTIVKVVEIAPLIGAWDYIERHENVESHYIHKNPIHTLAVVWLKKGVDLARRTYLRQADGSTIIPREFFMTFWTDHRTTEVMKPAHMDVVEALASGDET